VGTSRQPGKGPTSTFQPVSEEGSRTARRLVSDFSFASSSSCGRVFSGGLDRSGIGQRKTSVRLPDASHLPSGENVNSETRSWWPSSRCGSSPVAHPTRTAPLSSPVAIRSPVASIATSLTALPWLEILCGIALVTGIFLRGASLILLGLNALFLIVIALRTAAFLRDGMPFFKIYFDCGCGFGATYAWKKLLEDGVYFILSMILLFAPSHKFTVSLKRRSS